jgi:mRNA-degrading endonuclease RelE of RelBE toxin-antitoxin system
MSNRRTEKQRIAREVLQELSDEPVDRLTGHARTGGRRSGSQAMRRLDFRVIAGGASDRHGRSKRRATGR